VSRRPIVACVLVLKQLEGLSDVEAIDRFTYDARWRYACGVGGWDQGLVEFDRTVLVRLRMRLESSDDPRRIFKVTTQVAAEAGLVGVKRVLDSAPLFDAVATMDTVTLIRSAIRGLLKTADAQLESELRAVLAGEDDYRAAGKPACDWDDADARAALIDRLAGGGGWGGGGVVGPPPPPAPGGGGRPLRSTRAGAARTRQSRRWTAGCCAPGRGRR
jgi:hypothetical protein